MVGEVSAYVQGESLKADTALLIEAYQLPGHQWGRTMAFPKTWPIELFLLTFASWILFLFVHPNVQQEFAVRVSTGSLKWFVITYLLAATYILIPTMAIFLVGLLVRWLNKERFSRHQLFRATLFVAGIILVIANFGSWYGRYAAGP